jgi:hypothetical protein
VSRSGLDALYAEIDLAEAECSEGAGPDEASGAATRAYDYFTAAGRSLRAPEALLARARLYRATSAHEEAGRDLRAAIAILERQRETVHAGPLRAMAGDVIRRIGDELIDLELTQGRSDAAFEAAETMRAWEVRPRTAAPASARLDDIAARVPADTAILFYSVGETRSAVWLLRRRTASLTPIAMGRAEFERRIPRGASPLADPVAYELAGLLLPGHLPAVPAQDRLVIVPDGPLHRVAFAALRMQNGQYLVERHPLAIAPSASMAAAYRADAPDREPTVLAVGNPAFDRERFPGLSPLPWSESEAAVVAASYAQREVLTGASATRSRVLALAPRADVMHLAVHGLVDDINPDESLLVLARSESGENSLRARDIAELPLRRSRLVVLAACETANGWLTRSEGPLGLAWAFLRAGVPAVVATWGTLNDRAAHALFDVFHREYRASGDAAGALQSAQLTLMRSENPALARPENWARVSVYLGSPPEGTRTPDEFE